MQLRVQVVLACALGLGVWGVDAKAQRGAPASHGSTNGVTLELPRRGDQASAALQPATTIPEHVTVRDASGAVVDPAARGLIGPVTYQGRLRDGGLPANGTYSISLAEYDAAVGGVLGATTFAGGWPVTDGVFTFPFFLDASTYDGSPRWVEIQVNGTTLATRQELTPAPKALKADSLQWPVVESRLGSFFTCTTLTDLGAAAVFSNAPHGTVAYLGDYNAGVLGTSNDEIGVAGLTNFGIAMVGQRQGTTGTDPAIWGISGSQSDSANAIVGELTSTNAGCGSAALRGINNGTGICGAGVWGSHAGSGYGVHGSTVGGTAIFASNDTSDAALFSGTQLGTTINIGGHVNGTGADGLYLDERDVASSDSAAIRAVMRAFGPDDSKAVWGINTDTDYYGVGVLGEGGWIGVRGQAIGTGANDYFGVYGQAQAGSGGTAHGVFGIASGAGTLWAGYFVGNCRVTGTFDNALSSIRIDHPLDPYNKTLTHSAVESPDMMNIYNGTAVLNAQGQARVAMPTYFEALNRDFQYQLTAIGASMPNLYVASEIQNGVFSIAGGVPGAKVSWQVTGVRQDAYAIEHRARVEQEKRGDERGRLLHPAAFGRAEEEGIDRSRELEVAHKLGH
ncbi:MAG: hypothetical protein KDA20_05575 [Phycisphaerales bacterium]|nr:hypothetical protein [Phycisphaerales bacterium]